jgi:hypothetical protein
VKIIENSRLTIVGIFKPIFGGWGHGLAKEKGMMLWALAGLMRPDPNNIYAKV